MSGALRNVAETAPGQMLPYVEIVQTQAAAVEVFAMTPRARESLTGVVEGPRCPDERLASIVGAEDVWDECAGNHTEASSETSERLKELSAKLHELPGMGADVVDFLAEVEALIPEYRKAYGTYCIGRPEDGRPPSLREWGNTSLLNMEADMFETELDI